MNRLLRRSLVLAACLGAWSFALPPAGAQAPKDKKEILDTYTKLAKEVAADDLDGHFQLALWCEANDLTTQAKRHLNRVVKLKPDHAEARKKLGHVQVEGKWLTPEEAKKLEEKAAAAERTTKGLVQYKGQWLPKEDVEKLKAGLVKVGEEWVTPEDAKQLKAGLVHHPETGEWIKKEDMAQAEKGLFPVEGKWVGEEEANRYHGNWSDAWRLATDHYTVTTNLPWAKAKPLRAQVEVVYARLKEIMGGVEPPPGRRNVFIFATPGDYNSYGQEFGGDYSSISGGWYSQGDENRPAVCLWDDDFGKINLPHALAFQYQVFVYEKTGIKEIPMWYIVGVCVYCDRYWDATTLRRWGCENIVRSGGVANYGQSWFKNFQISADAVEVSQKNLKDAGFLVCFVLHGGDEKALAGWKDFWLAVQEGGKSATLVRPIYKLEAYLADSNKKIRGYFQDVLGAK